MKCTAGVFRRASKYVQRSWHTTGTQLALAHHHWSWRPDGTQGVLTLALGPTAPRDSRFPSASGAGFGGFIRLFGSTSYAPSLPAARRFAADGGSEGARGTEAR
eukprot:scaffold6144_cov94-Isochrysis_galbana.AAC.4